MFYLPRWWMAGIFLFLSAGNFLVEYAYYRRWPLCHSLYGRIFGRMQRDNPDGSLQFSGGPFVMLSAFLTVVFFPRDIACTAFAIMLIGDTAAALVGRRWGKHKLVNGKSSEGVEAFIYCAWLPVVFPAAMLFHWNMPMLIAAMLATVAAAVAELFQKQLRLDDNLLLPLVAGAVMLLGRMF